MTESPPPPRQEQTPPSKARPMPPPQSPAQKRGLTRRSKPVICRVVLLDGDILETGISKKALGGFLFESVCEDRDILEKEYFGLTYIDDLDPHGTKYWLDLNKTVAHQKKRGKWEFEFAVKFYPPDPTVLKESLTRYTVCMQIRKDIVTGRLPCTFATQAVLGSFCVQADLGDWDEQEHGLGIDYIRDIPFAPHDDQTTQLLEKIAELHRDRKGMTPEQAEMQYLEYAKKIAMYGIHMHAAKDSDYVDIKIGVGASGISIYRENLRINRFVWPKVLKISYRRNKFLLRIRPGEFETFESWIAFKLPTNKLAKRLWKLAIEHHAFLRLREATEARRGVLPRFGSKYRYSGRTLYEARVNTESRSQLPFERTGSKQYINNNRTRSMDELPMKNRLPTIRDPNMSTTSADESFEDYPPASRTVRAVENSHIIRQEIKEEQEPRVIKPAENGTRREERPVTPTEIKIEHRFVRRRDPEDDDIDSRMPDPPREEPGPNRNGERRGVPTALAAVGLPPSVRRYDDSDRGSLESLEMGDRKPALKKKPPTAPKPEIKKKPVIVREMDL
ncbi:band 4.1-like protein 1 [Littorina saxatilis]|uniref:FERM domain-containing protein n=1 Tax=Littorina saxatilis TaxID=31220 RepID=A0AAN9B743_9CAEN